MISYRLDIALQEAIQAHADQHKHGILEMEKILAALGELTASYLAEVPGGNQRQHLFNTLCIGIADAANGKTQTRDIGLIRPA